MVKSDSRVTTYTVRSEHTEGGQQAARSWKEMRKSLAFRGVRLQRQLGFMFRASARMHFCGLERLSDGACAAAVAGRTGLSGVYPGLYFLYALPAHPVYTLLKSRVTQE